jgi:hypothetical protein
MGLVLVLQHQSWSWCLSSSSVIVSSKAGGKDIPRSNAIQFELVFSASSPDVGVWVVVLLLSHQRKKKESGDSFVNVYLRLWLTCNLLSASCRLYWLQISGMSFTLTWPHRLCLFRVLLDAGPFCFLQYTALPSCCNCSLFLFRVHVGMCPSPTLSVGHIPLSKNTRGGGATPAFSGRLVYLQCTWGSAPPPGLELSTLQPLLQAFPIPRLLGGCCRSCLLWQACLFTGHMGECPSSTL